MSCAPSFQIDDGTLIVEVTSASTADQYQIGRALIESGTDQFRAASGTAKLNVFYEKIRYQITGAGPGDPGLWALDINVASWDVTIPGFADGSPGEVWTVIPARPQEQKDRRGGVTSWTLTLEEA